jgi:release factor glutamine methyltransferase
VTVAEALRFAEERLAEAGVDTPQVDAELLAAHVLGVTRTALYAERSRELTDEFERLLERRRRREPLAYVLGEWGFRRLTLKTDPRALIPRPETEVVVERCLHLLRDEPAPRVLDLGAGTGAIALAIADEHPAARVTAVDSSPGALALARENAELLGSSVDIRAGGLDVAEEGWDLVVSNPPYVAPKEWDSLQPEIRDWEPRLALVGEGFHEEIARRARTRWLVLEVGDGQAEGVADALASLGYSDVTISRDLSGRERVIEGRRS